jgi:cytosine/adenosine deaminase-related metal-dependent hydrolase
MFSLFRADYGIFARGVTRDAAILVEGDTIIFAGAYAEALTKYPGAPVTDFGEAALSPAFVNGHTHLYGILAHCLEPPFVIRSFESFLNDYWWPLVENQLDAEMLAAAAEASALELLESGVTSLCDCIEAPLAAREGLEAEAAVLRRLGLRALLSVEASERISPENGRRCVHENAEFLHSLKGDPLISSCLCLHTAFTCPRSFIEETMAKARALDTEIQLHLNESRYEPEWCQIQYQKRTAEWYEEIGLLSDKLIAAQCVQVSEKEIEALARNKVRPVHVPLSNCEVGGGIAPVPAMLEKGLPIALGTDGYVNNFFEVMRAAFLIHKGREENSALMPAKTVWDMATVNGAAALYGQREGRPSGKLQAGSPADFIAIDLSDLPSGITGENLFEQLILYRNPSDVKAVFTAGKALKKDGALLTADRLGARKKAREQSLRLKEAGRAGASKKKIKALTRFIVT